MSVRIEGETGLIFEDLLKRIELHYIIKKEDAKIALQRALRSEAVMAELIPQVERELLSLNGMCEHNLGV